MSGGREQVVAAARELFDERGYADVSVRDIAERAGVSPALVMKHGGSKQELFREVSVLPEGPKDFGERLDGLGERLVAEVLAAQLAGRPSPLTRSVVLMIGAPDVPERRAAVRARYLDPLVALLVRHGVEQSEALRRAQAAIACVVGLSTSLRTLQLFRELDQAELTVRYGALVQAALGD